ncbi:glucosaminidase domain-containing protein [Salinispirillum sp. LH 10-3-1]|uniref:Glucosaminidase domain-containing protein n=1 Tax=Salinispirillum sp. LH 10-3-1 TaxID=2952525 RepID=A0AB38YJ15_9GAMM
MLKQQYPRANRWPLGWLVIGVVALLAAFWGWERGQDAEERAREAIRAAEEAAALALLALPDFASEPTVQARKDAFYSYLIPLAEAENERVLRLRAEIKGWHARLQAGEELSERTVERLLAVSELYYVSRDQSLLAQTEALLVKVDAIPMSLIIAQAANESAWGTSRFALLGNNLFGQWCFSEGCGVVPRGRPEGETYEVRAFDHAGLSVRAYILNLNRHNGYDELRALRAAAREESEVVSGLDLTAGLIAYSTRREEYVEELNAMIRFNGLQALD